MINKIKINSKLNAKNATIILFVYFIARVLGVFLVIKGYKFINPDVYFDNNSTVSNIIIIAKIVSEILGIIFLFIISNILIGNHLRDNSLYGASWVLGSYNHIFIGCFLGVIIACVTLICDYLLTQEVGLKLFSFNKTKAFFRISFLIPFYIVQLTITPIAEELLFRGILFGGFNKSFGVLWSVIITTVSFVALHVGKINLESNLIIGITLLAIMSLWLRFRSCSIGPSVSLHFFYNLIILIYFWSV